MGYDTCGVCNFPHFLIYVPTVAIWSIDLDSEGLNDRFGKGWLIVFTVTGVFEIV